MAHSVEIRERAVEAYVSGAGSYDYVAGLFQAGSASLKRWVRRCEYRLNSEAVMRD